MQETAVCWESPHSSSDSFFPFVYAAKEFGLEATSLKERNQHEPPLSPHLKCLNKSTCLFNIIQYIHKDDLRHVQHCASCIACLGSTLAPLPPIYLSLRQCCVVCNLLVLIKQRTSRPRYFWSHPSLRLQFVRPQRLF